jgi:hypothetical protein
MIDPATIVALLAGGAIAKMEGLGGALVIDAYAGLKRILTDAYGFAADKLLERNPRDESTRKAAEADIVDAATRDIEVENFARQLEAALASVSDANWKRVGVVIDGLSANRTVELGNVTARHGSVTIRNVQAVEGDIRIGDIAG